uniref:Integrase catalytic domain-containing protein n=1 Tax=Peronospora matthiolae TaxID=2874970 RepID=A0AAV1V9Z2_9STRA
MGISLEGGAKYALTFVDEHSRYVSIILFKIKSKVTGKLEEFKTMLEN